MISNEIIENIGIFSPWVLLLFSSWILRKQKIYLYFYIIGFFLDILLNMGLKEIFHEKRPYQEQTKDYGMPSGHAESAVFCWTFLWYMFPKLSWFTAIGALLVICTEIHRYVYRRHTLEQLLVGSLVGFFMAQLTLWSAEIFIRN